MSAADMPSPEAPPAPPPQLPPPPSSSPPPRPAPPKQKGGSLRWLRILILTLIAGAAGGSLALYWPPLADRLRGDTARADIIALQERTAQVEARLDMLENAPVLATPEAPDAVPEAVLPEAPAADVPAILPPPADLGPFGEGALAFQLNQIGNRLSALEAEAADLVSRLDGAVTRDEQTQLIQRLAALEAANSGEYLRRAAQMLALSEVARIAATSSTFVAQMNTLAATVPGDPAIGILRAHAEDGVPTFQDLLRTFPEAARAALDAEIAASDAGFVARMWNSMRHLVSLRRVGDVEGTDSASILARAELALGSGDLATAVAEVNALTGAAAQSVTPWLSGAEVRFELDDVIAAMSARIIAVLSLAPDAVPVAPPASGGAPEIP